MFQMDKCLSDNKMVVFSFASLLTTMTISDIFEVDFLLVGYAHEDTDGTYGRLSTQIKRKDIFLPPTMQLRMIRMLR
jgi:hypothetical protein